MHQDTKYWAKTDEMLLSTKKPDPGPIDPFKTVHEKVQKKN